MHVYIYENVLNGKRYVGQTIQTLSRRWTKHIRDANHGSKYHFHKAIALYGSDSFRLLGAIELGSKEDMDFYERLFIEKFECMNPERGYNNTVGGEGGTPSNEVRARMSISARGRTYSEEVRNKISHTLKGRIPWNKGKILSEETREKMRVSHTGRRIGWHHTEESIQKIRESRKLYESRKKDI